MKSKNAHCGLAMAVVWQMGMLACSAQTNKYLYSGSETNITLPPGTYIITAYGAPGGDAFYNQSVSDPRYGGLGAAMSAKFNFSMSTNLTLLVGGGGSPGNFDSGVEGDNGYGSGGGGGSFVVQGNTPLVIAGGGGGGSYGGYGSTGNVSTNGSSGGLLQRGGTGGGGGDGSGGTGGGGGFLGNGGGTGGGFSFENGGNGGSGPDIGYGGGGYGGGGGSSAIFEGDSGGSGGGGGGYSGGGGGNGNGGYGGGGGGSIIDSSAIAILTEISGIASPDDSTNGEIIITAVPTPLVVTNSADSGPGTLRSAIANAASGAVITFAPRLSGATITLSSALTINTNLTIDASALSGGLQINGNGSVQIFNVATNITVLLNSLTITNGNCPNNGGGIYNNGTLTLTNCILSGNSAPGSFGSGGAIYNTLYATLTLYQCTLSRNSAADGGGIFNLSATMTMNQCTLSGNSSTEDDGAGGGIFNGGTLTLTNCTLSGNSVTDGSADGGGGGIYNLGLLTLNQCTLSGNSSVTDDDNHGGGGGIYNAATATLNQCTLSGNSTTNGSDGVGGFTPGGGGGGIFNDGVLTITNTIVGGNSSPFGADIYSDGVLTYGGSNLVQTVYNGLFQYGPAPLTSTPDLAPLGNYGGPTQTMPPLPGSPAIDTGSNAATNNFATDQRGYPRTQTGLIDLGAVELQPPAANPPVVENITVPAGGGNGLQFTFTSASVADFTVLKATNVSLALTNWTLLGEVQQIAPGQYQFTDPQGATNLMRFYRVRSP